MMDIISMSSLSPHFRDNQFNSKKPDFIKVKMPIADDTIEDYFDIIDWNSFDIRLLFNLPLELIRQIIFEERIEVNYLISSLRYYFLEHPFDKGGSIVMIESLRCFREIGKKNDDTYNSLYYFINKHSKTEQFSSVIFQSLIAMKVVYKNMDEIDFLLKITYDNAVNYNNQTLIRMIEGEYSDILSTPEYESIRDLEARISEELVAQSKNIREIEEEDARNYAIKEQLEIAEKKDNNKKFLKLTGIMLLIYCVAVPAVVSTLVYLVFGNKFNDNLISFSTVKCIGGSLYALIGYLIYRFKKEDAKGTLNYLKDLYRIWVLIGVCTGSLKLIMDITL